MASRVTAQSGDLLVIPFEQDRAVAAQVLHPVSSFKYLVVVFVEEIRPTASFLEADRAADSDPFIAGICLDQYIKTGVWPLVGNSRLRLLGGPVYVQAREIVDDAGKPSAHAKKFADNPSALPRRIEFSAKSFENAIREAKGLANMSELHEQLLYSRQHFCE